MGSDGPIYIIAPNLRQAMHWAETAGIPPGRAQYAGDHFRNLRGVERDTTVYRVGGRLDDSQHYEFYGWVESRFNIVDGAVLVDGQRHGETCEGEGK